MLPRSKSKRIMVGGNAYRYLVTELGLALDGDVLLAVTIQRCSNNGALLRVVGLTTHRLPEERSKFYRGLSVDQAVTPRHVARLIRLGESRGWDGTSAGPVFVVEVSNAEVFAVS